MGVLHQAFHGATNVLSFSCVTHVADGSDVSTMEDETT
jgi:hypothetical protein